MKKKKLNKAKISAGKKQGKNIFIIALKSVFWFATGAIVALFLFSSFAYVIFEKIYSNRVYPGITVDGVDLGKKTKNEVLQLFEKRNGSIKDSKFTFSFDSNYSTASAEELKIGYNANLIAKQAISLGRSENFLSNVSIALHAYVNGINLDPSYNYSEETLNGKLKSFEELINVNPVEAQFSFLNGKVTTFKASVDGKKVNIEKIKKNLETKSKNLLSSQKSQEINIPIAVETISPKITTDKANNLGIKELIGSGTSLFAHSIPNRIYNVSLAASRLNGILIAPNEVFSFNKALGDVSFLTGYKEAYVIQNGRTVLGDGGGVCQVSTTLFRALLDSGLPILERHAHAYRVGYYEQDSGPGLDATVYAPSVDLKFKNDTGNYILIQTAIDLNLPQLTFYLYGTKDGRSVTLTKPVITSQSPPPPDVNQDDPTLPKGQIKQVDFAAWGANTYFSREVSKNGKVIISEKFVSNYRPWANVFLLGTKE